MSETGLTCIGQLMKVHGPVVKIACEKFPLLHQALIVNTAGDQYQLEVNRHLNDKHIRAKDDAKPEKF